MAVLAKQSWAGAKKREKTGKSEDKGFNRPQTGQPRREALGSLCPRPCFLSLGREGLRNPSETYPCGSHVSQQED